MRGRQIRNVGVFLVRRLVEVAAVLALLSVLLFHLLHLMPGSPEDLLVVSDPRVRAEDVARLKSLRGLDRPIIERYACWIVGRGTDRCAWWPSAGLVHGDLGYSRVHKMPVEDVIGARLANTLSLMVPAFLFALLLAIPLGVISAIRRDAWPDHVTRAVTFVGLSLPVHWLGMLAVGVGAVALGWFPAGGVDDPRAPGFGARLHHAVLPVLVLSFFYVARWTRFTRASVLEVLHLDMIEAARARGLPERTILINHVLRNAAIPIVTVVAQSLPALFSGTLIVESVFSYPGMGVLIYESVQADDYLVAMVVLLAFSLLTMVATLSADALYWWLDPRMRDGLRGPR